MGGKCSGWDWWYHFICKTGCPWDEGGKVRERRGVKLHVFRDFVCVCMYTSKSFELKVSKVTVEASFRYTIETVPTTQKLRHKIETLDSDTHFIGRSLSTTPVCIKRTT